jgi:hypothetical protein
MGLLSLNLPVIGQSSATEDQKIRDALAAIQTDSNGNVTDANISATAAIQESKLANGVNGMSRGAFYAYRNAAQSIPTGVVTPTLVNFNAERFDVSGWFDTVTNIGRFTPQVAGTYRFSWLVKAGTTPVAGTAWETVLRKNGADEAYGQVNWQTGAALNVSSGGSAEAQANGTTDFFEVFVQQNSGVAVNTAAQASFVYFCGELVGRS